MIGKVMYLVAIFLPWYLVHGSVDAGAYSTDGWVEIVKIDGMTGVQINELLTGGALPKPVSYLPVPLGWVLLFFFVLSIIGIFRAKTTRSRGWKFFRGGIVVVIIIAILYFMVSRLSDVLSSDAPSALTDLIGYIAQNPVGGTASQSFGDYGQVNLKWGLELGGYLLVFSAITQVIAGFMEWGSSDR
jgi:hypothetical protein